MELNSEQEAQASALVDEWLREIARTGVDMPAASLELEDVNPPTVRQISATESTEIFTVDVTGILATLRSLPDNCGTATFVAAYRARLLAADESPYADEP